MLERTWSKNRRIVLYFSLPAVVQRLVLKSWVCKEILLESKSSHYKITYTIKGRRNTPNDSSHIASKITNFRANNFWSTHFFRVVCL